MIVTQLDSYKVIALLKLEDNGFNSNLTILYLILQYIAIFMPYIILFCILGIHYYFGKSEFTTRCSNNST